MGREAERSLIITLMQVEYAVLLLQTNWHQADYPNASLFLLSPRSLSPVFAIVSPAITHAREVESSLSPTQSIFPFAEAHPRINGARNKTHCPISLQTCFFLHLIFLPMQERTKSGARSTAVFLQALQSPPWKICIADRLQAPNGG